MTATIEQDQALLLWAEQVESLICAPESAEQAIATIHERFGQLHMWYSEQGDLKTAQYIADTFDHAKVIYEQAQQSRMAVETAKVIIYEMAGQRAAALDEVQSLIDAIRTRNESHPQLKAYAEEIRTNERETLMEDDGFLEEAEISGFIQIEREIRANLHRQGLSSWQSQRLLEYLIGHFQMDQEQRSAFSNFLDTLS